MDKGSRQNRSVTSGQGLALRAGSVGFFLSSPVCWLDDYKVVFTDDFVVV